MITDTYRYRPDGSGVHVSKTKVPKIQSQIKSRIDNLVSLWSVLDFWQHSTTNQTESVNAIISQKPFHP